ncbi:MAG: hypothetical protein ACJ71T_16575 [Actinomycetales bacterium]
MKLVIISSSAGATERAVIARITTIEELGLPFVPGTVTVTVPLLSALPSVAAAFFDGPLGWAGLPGSATSDAETDAETVAGRADWVAADVVADVAAEVAAVVAAEDEPAEMSSVAAASTKPAAALRITV